MALPGVSISLANGALGGLLTSEDGVCGLVLTGVTTGLIAPFALGVAKPIYSLTDAIALGITADGANAAAYRHIKEFYDLAGPSAELWIMLVADTMTLTQMADKTNVAGAQKLVAAAGGRLRLLGLARTPAVGYTPVLTAGIDADSISALVNAQALAEEAASLQRPLRVLVEGRAFLIANVGDLEDLRQHTQNRAGIVLGSTKNDGSASVGLTLGRAAATPVQRNLGRVKDGAMPVLAAYVGDKAAEALEGAAETIHNKGYIFLRTYVGKAGYFFNDDPMAAQTTDDYSQLSRGRVIDKAQRITYLTYVDEVNSEVLIAADGTLALGVVKYLESKITRQIELGMKDEISSVSCFIDPAQNVLATNTLNVQLRIVPVGYFKTINVSLGFANPAA